MKPGVPSNNSNPGERADVVGAGLAGISAARVVFDFHGIDISRLARAYNRHVIVINIGHSILCSTVSLK
jgi:hypothetical protein